MEQKPKIQTENKEPKTLNKSEADKVKGVDIKKKDALLKGKIVNK